MILHPPNRTFLLSEKIPQENKKRQLFAAFLLVCRKARIEYRRLYSRTIHTLILLVTPPVNLTGTS